MLLAIGAGLAIGLAVGMLGGGASLSDRVPQRPLGRAFAALIVGVAGWLLVSASV